MLLRYFYDKPLAQASYMLGSKQTREALIVDPARDISPYLAAAREENMTIAQVVETHIHADFVSGSRELAAQTGARLYLSAMGGADWAYAYADENTNLVREGDCWFLGGIRIDVMHMPGHSPEHLVLQVTNHATTDHPMGLFTGDCLFVGDVGRPDLLDAALDGARDQFKNVQRLKAMPDYLQVWPGHGAGSSCGKALGAVPSSTLGYEKRVNPAFQFEDEGAFSAWLLEGQPEMPSYFQQMKRVNRLGAALLETLERPLPMEGFILAEILKGDALVIDTRVDGAHAPGTLHIVPDTQFSTYAGWFVHYDAPTYLIAAPDEVDRLLGALRSVGVDNLPGYFTPEEVGDLNGEMPTIGVEEAVKALKDGAIPLDVRSRSEYRERHIAGALNIPYGLLPQYLGTLPQDRRIIIYCASGTRSQIAASLLMREGFRDFTTLAGGLDAWTAAGGGLGMP